MSAPFSSDAEVPRIPFTQLMALEPIGGKRDVYRSIAKPYAPMHRAPVHRAYGGHVYAQAAWAASRTVEAPVDGGFVLHNMTGFFTLPGLLDRPFIYNVTRVRDGGSYCTRAISVTQEDGEGKGGGGEGDGGVCFMGICSFKRDEESDFEHQESVDLKERYSEVLGEKRPEDHEAAPDNDTPWYINHAHANQIPNIFPGLDVRKVAMDAYNSANNTPLSYRQLQYYRIIGPLPSIATDPNIHACAHLYASDRNSLFLLARALGVGDGFKSMASLSHSVVFHGPVRNLSMSDTEDNRKEYENEKEETKRQGEPRRLWFCQESRTSRSGNGRGLHESKIWDQCGRHVVSTWQDGLLRLGEGQIIKAFKGVGGKKSKI
ncbi:MAG: hypothetical protein M1827_006357 [Pycnora praestabilis]|nr:MAG: hypothetical protein M1827_006357 [Pycnora praestabilis]